MTLRSFIAAFALLVAASAGGLSAQIPVEFSPGSSELTRKDLERLLASYEQAVASPAYSSRVKDAARANMARIRTRLEEGDFRVGDRVALTVEGENAIPDTVVVEPGPQITLPLFGAISLAGVLRSETTEYLTKELGKVIREPVVRATALMRLSIQGGVRTPGFYLVPASMLVSEAIMEAGGPTTAADLEHLQIQRGTAVVVDAPAMQEALIDGRTLDQLSLQAGDQLLVPAKTAGGTGAKILQLSGVFVSITYLIIRLTR